MRLVIFGCGKITKRIAAAVNQVDEITLQGFASKNLDKAKEYCEEYGGLEYGDYDHFLNSDEVDAVYIATYNQSHYELIKKCLEHHKHVICEKPMLFSEEQISEMFALARENNVLLMEALKSVFLPIIIKVRELIEAKTIGNISTAYASFMRCGSHPSNHWINDPKCGGAGKDLGSYCIGTLNYLFGPGILQKVESDRTADKADTTAYFTLKYNDNIQGRASVSNTLDGDCTLMLEGTKGLIRVDNFWKSGEGYYEADGKRYELKEELISDFYYELKHFADLIENGSLESPVMGENASIDIVRITSMA